MTRSFLEKLLSPQNKAGRLWLVGVLCGLAIPATLPLWQPAFLFTADSPLHLWRVYELDRALRQGIFYPRWAPDLYFGYGYPLFNFYPPLAYYFVETLHILGLDIANAIKIAFAFCIFLAAGSMFLLGRDFYSAVFHESWKQNAAGLVTATAYAYAPYFLLDIYTRGAITEVLGMALLPLYVWSLRKLISQPTVARALTAGALGAAFLLSHNLTAFFAAPALAGFILLKLLAIQKRARPLGLLGLSIVAALALSAFYWLPSVMELAWVYVGQPKLRHAELLRTMTEHFQSLANIVQWQWFYQYPEGPFPLAFGSLFIALVGFGMGLLWLGKRERLELAYWGIVALLAAFALTDLSRPLWFAFPSLWVIQFAWRLTVFITLATALASGAWMLLLIQVRQSHRVALLVASLLILNLMAIGMVNLRAQSWQTAMPSPSAFHVLARYEANVRAGLGSMDEYLPVWVRTIPQAVTPQRGAENTNALKAIPNLELNAVSENIWNISSDASEAFTLRWRTFYYPDWRAEIDGQPAILGPSTAFGLLTLEAPAGQHHIRVTRESLPVRTLGNSAALVAVLSIGAWCAWQIRRGAREWKLPAALIAALLFVFLFPQVRALAASTPALEPAQIEIDETLRVVAFRVDRASREQIKAQVIWQVKKTPARETPLKLELTDSQGRVWSARNTFARYGTSRMREWMPNELVRDWYDLGVPNDLPRGEYELRVARGKAEWKTVTTLTLQGAGEIAPPMPVITHPLDAQFGDSIRLLGYDAPSLENLRAMDSIPLTLYWRADNDVMEDYSVFAQLLDQDGNLVAQHDSLPNNGFTPTMLWQPGAIIADQHTLPLPPTLQPGRYQLITGLYRFNDLSRLPVSTNEGPAEDDFVILAPLKIPADRSFTPEHYPQAQFGSAILLRGFSLRVEDEQGIIKARASGDAPPQLQSKPNGFLQLDMEWSAKQAPQNAYTVFLHLVDVNGNVVRQQDNQPVGGRYPTTIWESGERIVDTYRLPLDNLPEGAYMLRLGMYATHGGERLSAFANTGAELAGRQVDLARVTIAP